MVDKFTMQDIRVSPKFGPVWGLRPSDDTKIKIFWGARAIHHPGEEVSFSLDGTRITAISIRPDQEELLPHESDFMAWVKNILKTKANDHARWLIKNEVYHLEHKNWVFKMTPKNSYGYLFIGAWELAE